MRDLRVGEVAAHSEHEVSADAQVWFDEDANMRHGLWKAIHDGECANAPHEAIAHDLSTLLKDIESCMNVRALRWTFRTYVDGSVGLSGYVA